MPLFSSWTTAVKLAWSVPRGTRTYLVQQVLYSGLTSGKVDIMSRFVNFFKGFRTSPSPEVQIMANLTGRDIRATTGSNLRLLEETSGPDPWSYSSAKLKEKLIQNEIVTVFNHDAWRVSYLARLLERRSELHYLALEEEEKQITSLINSLCLN